MARPAQRRQHPSAEHRNFRMGSRIAGRAGSAGRRAQPTSCSAAILNLLSLLSMPPSAQPSLARRPRRNSSNPGDAAHRNAHAACSTVRFHLIFAWIIARASPAPGRSLSSGHAKRRPGAGVGTALYALRARSRLPFPPRRGAVSALKGNDRMTQPPYPRIESRIRPAQRSAGGARVFRSVLQSYRPPENRRGREPG